MLPSVSNKLSSIIFPELKRPLNALGREKDLLEQQDKVGGDRRKGDGERMTITYG